MAIYIAVLETGKFRHRLNRDVLVDDLRRIAAAFDSYKTQKGDWPAATSPEVRLPRGMESLLATTSWSAGTPFGGGYAWTPPAKPKPGPADAAVKVAPGVIAITAFTPDRPLTLTRADLQYLDRKLDDGDLTTGRFQTGFNGWPIYQVPATR